MAVLVDPSGKQWNNIPDDQVTKYQTEFGFKDPAAFASAQTSGGFGNELATAGEEAGRQLTSGAAAVARAVTPGETNPQGLEPAAPYGGADIAPGLYSPEALARRQENPEAAALGGTVPLIAGGLAAPVGGALGLVSAAALDIGSGAAQEATDAEIEHRGISGEHVLRNAGMNLVFSAGGHILTAGAKALVRGTRNMLEEAANALTGARAASASVADGAELAQAAADPAVREQLLLTIADKTDGAVRTADRALEEVSGPRVAKNGAEQRDALETVSNAFTKSDPDVADKLYELRGASPAERYDGILQLRAQADPQGGLFQVLDDLANRHDLWGSEAISHASDVDAAMALKPPPGAAPDAVRAYTDAIRKVRGGELGGLADDIEHLNDRAQQIRLAPDLGGIGDTPSAAAKPVDYDGALNVTPEEAWRLKQGGGIEGTRILAAHNVADAADRVTQGLKQDVAMSVKREDFAAGAQNWTPALIAKQTEYAGKVFDRAAELLQKADQSRGPASIRGYDWGGIAQDTKRAVQPALTRLSALGDSLDDAITRNSILDQMKQGVDKVIDRVTNSGSMEKSAKADALRELLGFSNELRTGEGGLEDTAMWGQNASLQKDLNRGWTAAIDPWGRVQKQMSEYLGKDFGKGGEESAVNRRWDPNDIARSMGGAYDRGLRKDLADGLAGLDKLIEARQIRGLSRLDELASHRADLVRIQEAFKLNDVLKVADKVAREPLAEAVLGKLVKGAHVVGAVAGHAVGGLGGTAAGGALGTLASRGVEGMTARGMLAPGAESAFARVMRKEFSQMGSEQGALIADPAFTRASLSEEMQRQLMAAGSEQASERTLNLGSAAKQAAEVDQKTTARLMVNTDAAAHFVRFAGDAGTAITRFRGDHDTLQQAYVAQRSAILNFASNPMALVDTLTDEFGSVADQSPALHAQMVEQAFKIQSFLAAKLPGQRNVSVAYPNGTPAGADEIRSFALYYAAATDPKSVLADARSGKLRKEQVDTLQQLWPLEYAGLRNNVLQELGSGKPTAAVQQRMSLLFGFGGSVNPAFGANVSGLMAAASAARAQRPRAPGIHRAALKSQSGLLPAGQANLQLGPSLDQ